MITRILKCKKLVVAIALAVAIGLGSWAVTPAQAQQTLNLKAVWNASTDDSGTMGGYYFYKDAGMMQAWKGLGVWGSDSTNPLALPVSPQLLLFTTTVPDTPTIGTINFAMKAFDTNGNISAYSPSAPYTYNVDVTPPSVVTGLTITKQP